MIKVDENEISLKIYCHGKSYMYVTLLARMVRGSYHGSNMIYYKNNKFFRLSWIYKVGYRRIEGTRMKIYISGFKVDDTTVCIPLSSSVILFLLKYCKAKSFRLHLVECKDEGNENLKTSIACLQDLEFTFIDKLDVPLKVSNCVLPVIEVNVCVQLSLYIHYQIDFTILFCYFKTI